MGTCCGQQAVKNDVPMRTFSRKSSILFDNFSKQTDYKKKYEFLSILGSGGFGKVRLYRDKKAPDMKYAIKTIKKEFPNRHAIISLIREVDILRKLDHPNIVKYFETYEDDHFINIVMEYIGGDNLLKMIANKAYMDFGEQDILGITTVLLKTVYFLHSNNIVHRDLKPGNILFSIAGDYESLKVIDFGLSIGKKEKDFYRVGSPYYMAPEQVEGTFCFESDVWSIGVILFFMVTGKQPFYGATREQIYKKILKGKYDKSALSKGRCSESLKDLIKKMLVVDPKKRFNIHACLDHPWVQQSNLMIHNNPFGKEILDSIREFNKKNVLQKEILFMMARISKESEILKLKQAFTVLDKDNSGEIEFGEIPAIFERLGIKPKDGELESIWNSMDFHQDGKVNYSEFLAATLESVAFSKEEKLWSVFQYFDPKDTGYITAESVISALKERNLNINEEGLIDMFKDFENTHQKMTFEEFKNIFYSQKKSR